MASTPLLDGQAADGDVSIEAQYLSDEQPDFSQVIAQDPEQVIAYIEQKGVQDLGTFKVQVLVVSAPVQLQAYPLARVLTAGRSEVITRPSPSELLISH